MKKNLLLLFLILQFTFLISNFSSAQNPLVKMWDKRYGGTSLEWITCLQPTSDGGQIMGGYTASGNSGNKTQPTIGMDDYWIVKTDSWGNKKWDKDFGGTDTDWLFSIQQTADGGYILGGNSVSGISGDKTQANQGIWDYWIVKIDSLGNKQWDRDFGGSVVEELSCVQQTRDKGYILGGYSNSGISGDKTELSQGANDYWIVKTDSLGNKQWDKDLGGTSDDVIFSLQQTSDGGFIMGGQSSSGIGGDKTQSSWGNYDYWIVKTDSLGNKQWDKDFGGTATEWLRCIGQTADHGYILGGYTPSSISGDKTQASWGQNDWWIVKTDSLGNKEWDKDFGGTEHEELYKITEIPEGGYLLSGDSYSSISGDKSENNFGVEQTWILKIDSSGNKIWDKTIFTSGHDETGMAIKLLDGCYVIANSTYGAIAGYKTEPTWDLLGDYWIIKFCDSTAVAVAAFTSGNFICTGTCIDYTNLSFNTSSYQWSFPGASPDTSTAVNPTNICYSTPGSYDVQLIATNANGSDTLTLANYITVYPGPPPQSITQNGDTLFAIAGATTYQWYFNGNVISGASDYFYVAPQSGDYNLVATDANGCEVEAAIFNVVANILSTMDRAQLTVFPNPVEKKLTVTGYPLSGTAVEVSVYNMLGELVLAATPFSAGEGPGGEADVSQLPPGLYYLVITAHEKSFHTKFVKE
jgi:PKD repeat protein